jgi:hypothetical protein
MFAFQSAELIDKGDAKNLKNSNEIVRERDLAKKYSHKDHVAHCNIISSEHDLENGGWPLISGQSAIIL